jgi:hypothetical protein
MKTKRLQSGNSGSYERTDPDYNDKLTARLVQDYLACPPGMALLLPERTPKGPAGRNPRKDKPDMNHQPKPTAAQRYAAFRASVVIPEGARWTDIIKTPPTASQTLFTKNYPPQPKRTNKRGKP